MPVCHVSAVALWWAGLLDRIDATVAANTCAREGQQQQQHKHSQAGGFRVLQACTRACGGCAAPQASHRCSAAQHSSHRRYPCLRACCRPRHSSHGCRRGCCRSQTGRRSRWHCCWRRRCGGSRQRCRRRRRQRRQGRPVPPLGARWPAAVGAQPCRSGYTPGGTVMVPLHHCFVCG